MDETNSKMNQPNREPKRSPTQPKQPKRKSKDLQYPLWWKAKLVRYSLSWRSYRHHLIWCMHPDFNYLREVSPLPPLTGLSSYAKQQFIHRSTIGSLLCGITNVIDWLILHIFLTFSGHEISDIRCRHVGTLELYLPLRKLHSCCRELPRHLPVRHLQSRLPEW